MIYHALIVADLTYEVIIMKNKKGFVVSFVTVAAVIFSIVFSIIIILLVQIDIASLTHKVEAKAEDPAIAEIAINSFLKQKIYPVTVYPSNSNKAINLMSSFNNTHDGYSGSGIHLLIEDLMDTLSTKENLNLTIGNVSFPNNVEGRESSITFRKVAIPGVSYVEQENASVIIPTNSVGPSYLYVEYEKPMGVSGANWTLKHGNIPEYSTEIPDSCWRADKEKVMLRISSDLANARSEPQCFDGTNWITIGNVVDLANVNTNCNEITGANETYDASWYSFAVKDTAVTDWYWCDDTDPSQVNGLGAAIYEEKILWRTKGSYEKISMRYYK